MSNLIKYPYVNMTNKEAFIVNKEEDDDFVPLYADKAGGNKGNTEDAQEDSEFESGLNIRNMDEILETERLKSKAEADEIIEEAKRQADAIIQKAHEEAEAIRAEGFSSGHQEGYAEGERDAKERYGQLEEELADRSEKQQQEYDQMISEIEPRYVEVLISLIQKITGILIEDKKEILLYLIKNSVRNLDKSKRYVLRISSEDSLFLDVRKGEIRQILGDDVALEFVEEKDLEGNQCIIETDSQMMDCGFQTQLQSLIETLRIIAS